MKRPSLRTISAHGRIRPAHRRGRQRRRRHLARRASRRCPRTRFRGGGPQHRLDTGRQAEAELPDVPHRGPRDHPEPPVPLGRPDHRADPEVPDPRRRLRPHRRQGHRSPVRHGPPGTPAEGHHPRRGRHVPPRRHLLRRHQRLGPGRPVPAGLQRDHLPRRRGLAGRPQAVRGRRPHRRHRARQDQRPPRRQQLGLAPLLRVDRRRQAGPQLERTTASSPTTRTASTSRRPR